MRTYVELLPVEHDKSRTSHPESSNEFRFILNQRKPTRPLVDLSLRTRSNSR